jgi:Chaperone of endosialidase
MALDFPNSPVNGQVYTSAGQSWVWDGTKWNMSSTAGGPYIPLGGGTMTGPLILSTDPSANLGAATKQYVDSTTVGVAGDTMSGPLILNADPSASLGAATKQYVDTKAGAYLPLVGGTLTGGLNGVTANFTGNVTTTANAFLSKMGIQATGLPMGTPCLFGVSYSAAGGTNGSSNQTIQPSLSINGGNNGAICQHFPAGFSGFFPVNILNTNSAATVGYLYGSGTGVFSFTISPSDERLKRNLKDAIGALTIVNKLKVRSCDVRSGRDDAKEGEGEEHWDFSLIAQEVEKVIPFAVNQPPSHAPDGMKGLNANHLVSVLWRAVQELSERLATIEGRARG